MLSNSLPSQHHGDPPQCSKGIMGEQPAQYPAQEQHNSIIHGMYLVHTECCSFAGYSSGEVPKSDVNGLDWDLVFHEASITIARGTVQSLALQHAKHVQIHNAPGMF